MSVDNFLHLKREEQAQILGEFALGLDYTSEMLEKDIWVCWMLDRLFTMPDHIGMAFKGGTSLSKAYEVIDRFSEDIDVTIDLYDDIRSRFEMPLDSNSKRRRFRDFANQRVREYRDKKIVPHLKSEVALEFGMDSGVTIEVEEMDRIDESDNTNVLLYYPSVLQSAEDSYVRRRVLLELGGRNYIEPSEVKNIEPYLKPHMPELSFPVAKVDVLSIRRTFWEKVTLLHGECEKGRIRDSANRLSRHWHDVFLLCKTEYFCQAFEDRWLLRSVVEYKKEQFYNASVDYDKCLVRAFRLVPDGESFSNLAKDYKAMLDSNMIIRNRVTFDELIEGIQQLEDLLNEK